MLASNGNKIWLRRLHAIIGIVSSVNLMVIGPIGLVALDVITLFWAMLLLSGMFIFTSKQLRLRAVDERTKIAMRISHRKTEESRAVSSVRG
jgi:hypothetical protein